MKKVFILIGLMAIMFSGCAGLITGHEYTKGDFVIMYKVVKKGVVTFMTAEQIESLKLDKADVLVTDTYKIVEKNDVPSQ